MAKQIGVEYARNITSELSIILALLNQLQFNENMDALIVAKDIVSTITTPDGLNYSYNRTITSCTSQIENESNALILTEEIIRLYPSIFKDYFLVYMKLLKTIDENKCIEIIQQYLDKYGEDKNYLTFLLIDKLNNGYEANQDEIQIILNKIKLL